SPEISLRMGLNLMTKNDLNSIPIIDEKEKLVGIVTVSDIMQSYIDVWDNSILGKVQASIDNILDTLSAEPMIIPEKAKKYNGEILVLAMDGSSSKEYIEENDIVICGNREDVQEIAINKNISLMIITGKEKLNEKLKKLAEEKDVTVITTPHDTYTAARLISQSIPVEQVMTKDNLVVFTLDDLVDEVKMKMSQTRYRSYPVIDHKSKIIGLISRYHLITSMKKKVILVDHNERSQSIDGLEEAEILEIIDHH